MYKHSNNNLLYRIFAMSIPAPKKTARVVGKTFDVAPVSAATTDTALRGAASKLTRGGTSATLTRATAPARPTDTLGAIAGAGIRVPSLRAAAPKPVAPVSKRAVFSRIGVENVGAEIRGEKKIISTKPRAAKKTNIGVNAGPTHQMTRSAISGKAVSKDFAKANPATTITQTVKDGGPKKSVAKKTPLQAAKAVLKTAVKKAAAANTNLSKVKAVQKVAAKKAAPAKKAASKTASKKK